jgi:sulfotransferase family protein
MNVQHRDGGTAIVAPQERPSQVKQYLTMLTSLDPVLSAKTNWNVDQFLELAQSRTQAVKLGADSGLHFEGLRYLAKSVQQDPYYDDIGRRYANTVLYNWVVRYLRFEQDLATFPEIRQVPVPKPLFLVGFGRTGSTFLHHLLTLDSRARTPRLWELTEPSPPPRTETYETDPRIRRVHMQLSTRSIMLPDVHKIHEYDAQGPEECQHMMWHGPHHLMLGLRSLGYWQWLRGLSQRQLQALYAGYKLQVQHLQLFHRGSHWVSKSLSHAYFYPVLFDIFPDARIVRLHRDPCQVIPALASLIAHLQIPYTSRVNFHELGQLTLDIFLDYMQRSIQIEKQTNPEHFIDVAFDDLTRDPVGTIREIYARFGYPYTDQLENALNARLREESVTRQYRHVYTPEQFGLSRAQIMTQVEDYLTWVEQRTGRRMCRP